MILKRMVERLLNLSLIVFQDNYTIDLNINLLILLEGLWLGIW